MIDKTALESFAASWIEGHGGFLVEVSVTPANEIRVEIDSPASVGIETCMELSRAIEAAFPRDAEDYELEVGSAGITSPLRVRAQYDKNTGRDVEVLTADGRKLRGVLLASDEDGFTLATKVKVRPEGAKRPVEVTVEEKFGYGDVKSVCPEIKF